MVPELGSDAPKSTNISPNNVPSSVGLIGKAKQNEQKGIFGKTTRIICASGCQSSTNSPQNFPE
jgi:hypothetical protein